jgi:SAM-dependent methyltransferase
VGSIAHNLLHWSRYDWSDRGDEWSSRWGGSANLWWGTLYPRVSRHLPAASILEIAPGAGRITRFLAPACKRLVLVELTPACLEICRQRFRAQSHLEYLLTDGSSLRGVGDRSIDFAFSFDSLVHADRVALGGYLSELARALVPSGAAFLHHSNLGRLVGPDFDELSPENEHWRDATVSASWVAEEALRHGLRAVVQEELGWGGTRLTDAFSLLVHAGGPLDAPPRRAENPEFMSEADSVRRTSELWRPLRPELGIRS